MNAKKIDDIYPETPTVPQPEQEATRFVDVHIYTLEDEETRSIEATLHEISKANQPLDDDDQPKQPQPGPKVSPFVSIIVGIALLALLGKGYLLYLLPLMTPTTTITIVPMSRQVQMTQRIQIVTETPDSSKGTFLDYPQSNTDGSNHRNRTPGGNRRTWHDHLLQCGSHCPNYHNGNHHYRSKRYPDRDRSGRDHTSRRLSDLWTSDRFRSDGSHRCSSQ